MAGADDDILLAIMIPEAAGYGTRKHKSDGLQPRTPHSALRTSIACRSRPAVHITSRPTSSHLTSSPLTATRASQLTSSRPIPVQSPTHVFLSLYHLCLALHPSLHFFLSTLFSHFHSFAFLLTFALFHFSHFCFFSFFFFPFFALFLALAPAPALALARALFWL